MSNLEQFKYCWIWEKEQGVNFLNIKKQPLKIHEDICIFCAAVPIYNPVMAKGRAYISGRGFSREVTNKVEKTVTINKGERFPVSILKFNRETGLHPTQKPIALFEYLIKTYTNEGDLILDNAAGSGTTGVAAHNLNRRAILIELDPDYFQIAKKRIEAAQKQQRLFVPEPKPRRSN